MYQSVKRVVSGVNDFSKKVYFIGERVVTYGYHSFSGFRRKIAKQPTESAKY